MRKVWMNGKIVDESEAKVSIYDSSSIYGAAVFSMLRSFNKVPFKLKEHIDRLYSGCKIYQIPLEEKMSKKEMEKAVYDIMLANDSEFAQDDEHRIFAKISNGVLGIYKDIEGVVNGVNVIISDFELRKTIQNFGPLYSGGINLFVSSVKQPPSRYLDPKVKNCNRTHYLLASQEGARLEGKNNWAILEDEMGRIVEGVGYNVFMIKNNVVITPPAENILRGISRDYIINELCQQLGLKCVEKNIERYDLYTADEVFISATPFCILPVTKFQFQNVGDGEVGNITKLLLKTWSDNVKVDIVAQAKSYYVGEQKGTSIYNMKAGK